METYHLTSAQDNLTGQYRQVGYMKNKEEASRFLQFWFWVVITAAAGLAFFILARNLGKLPEGFHIGAAKVGIGVIVFLGTIMLHEGLHALILRWYGARPKVELFKNNVLSTLTAPGYGLRRNTLIVVVLTPLVVLTVLAVLGIWLTQGTEWVALFALVAVVNLLAAIGDLWLVGILLRYPSSSWTVDDKEGMLILAPME